ncbi:hypothetical protein ACH5RR_004749 [Cinchona calisaya]|uniref:RING-type E3 ubiquitin transferase n=1 Tax=Cinchona calisaya TaxID=153742 RepID=A0ABD3AYJ1_9GENT
MGHRQFFSSSQMFENENDQEWNHVGQPYVHLARPGAPENSVLLYPPDNMTADGGHSTAQWNSAPRSTPGYSSSSLNVEMPHYQPQVPGPSRNPFLHSSAVGSLNTVQENYAHHASSSNHGGQTFHGVDGGCFELSMGNGRGPYKRKSPGISAVCERGNTSQYYDTGSSSDHSFPADLWLEKQNTDSHRSPWDFAPSYRDNGLSIGSEGTLRNVRSRPAFDLESNLARTHLPNNPSHFSFPSQIPDHPSAVDLSGQSSCAPPREWNHTFASSASNGRNIVSGTNFFSHETNQFGALNGNPSASLEIGGYVTNFSSNRNPVPQAFHGTPSQYSRGVRSGYSNRPVPTFRASSSNLHVGSTTASDEGLQLVAESYASRHPRPFSTIGIRTGDRNGRSRIPSIPISDHAGFHDQLTPEGLMIMDQSAIYGSRSLFDHHRDMRLDIDNMSYEELLALGERIGTVSTGLSEHLVSKCLTESLYFSSDQLQEGGTCIICLEEYMNMDDVGTLISCGHDFHVECIRKWLSIKNLCPICKASAWDDNMKEE